jgi:hypothetical protein
MLSSVVDVSIVWPLRYSYYHSVLIVLSNCSHGIATHDEPSRSEPGPLIMWVAMPWHAPCSRAHSEVLSTLISLDGPLLTIPRTWLGAALALVWKNVA